MAFIGGNLKDGDWTRLRQILQSLSTSNNMLKLKSIGILEGGSNPIKYTYLQGGDQTIDLTYTLPTAFPASIGFLKISDAGVMTTDVNTYITTGSALLLDQTSAQTFTGGAVTGTGLLKVTAGLLGLDTATYLTSVTAHNLLSTTHGDTLTDTVINGDLMVGNATPKWSRFAANSTATKKFLNMTSSVPSWDAIVQADVGGLTTGSSPTFVGLTLTGLALSSGLITSTTGAISFDNENLLTTGTLGAGAITGTSLLLNSNSTVCLKVEQTGIKNNTLVVDTTNGRVGVNILPSGTLEITNSTQNPTFRMTTNATAGRGVLFEASANNLYISPDSYNSPAYKFGLSVANRFGTATEDFFFQMQCASGAWNMFEGYLGAGLTIGTGGDNLPIVFLTNRVERARLTSTGFGFGKTPTCALDIVGAGLISTTLGVTGLITATGGLVATAGFGCNGATIQTAYASGGALSAYATGAFGFDSDAHASEVHALLVKIRAALVANGIMS